MSNYEYDTSWHFTMPTTLRIGHLDYTVRLMGGAESRDKRRFGEMNSNDQEICISPNQRPQSARDTLLHEALHAAWWVYNLPEDGEDVQEAACRVLPLALTLLRRDNPEAWAWIFEEEPCNP